MSAEITVCVATYRGAAGTRRAVESALDQEGPEVSVVVVNQGEPADLDHLIEEVGDRAVTWVSRPPRGLSMNRNEALALVETPWVAFLDDDDALVPEWSTIMARHLAEDVGIVSCSAELRTVDDEPIAILASDRPIDMVEEETGQHLAGCWVARTEVVRAIGGYLPGLGCSHQTELWIRLAPAVRQRGLRIAHDPQVGTHITRRPATERPLHHPTLLLEGGRWILARHRLHLHDPAWRRANAHGAVSVHAARAGRWDLARRFARIAAVAQPGHPKRWARLVATWLPPLARRTWGSADAYDTTQVAQNSVRLVRTLAADLPEAREPLLFLPDGYRTNPPASADRQGSAFWAEGTAGNDIRYQDPVYRWGRELLIAGDARGPVVDVGCGTGHKLVEHLAPHAPCIGVDQRSGIDLAREAFPDRRWVVADLASDDGWDELPPSGAGLVVCADVVEHVEDPYALLDRIRTLLAPGGRALISTPDRDRLDRPTPLGPPTNPRHIREWSAEEFELLLGAASFEIHDSRHLLPRRYSATVLELKRAVWRLLHAEPVPDRRSSMAFLVSPTTT